MGLLRRKDLPKTEGTFLRAMHSIGRDAENATVIPRASISGRHAILTWTTSGWVLKDTSKYGTIVNGALVRSAALPLKAGDELTFVEADEVWVLDNSAPPGLLLTSEGVEDGKKPNVIHVEHDTGLFAFPSPDAPKQTILQVGEGWVMEDEAGARRRLRDGDVIELGDVRYKVSVPPPSVATAEPDNPASPFSLDVAEVDIYVVRGEDEAELTIRSGAIERALKPSRPLYLLAYLAEQRARTPEDGGWLPTELVCSQLGVDRTVLNVDVHRVRESVKATGLVDGANIVERRPSQVRIGIPPARFRVFRR